MKDQELIEAIKTNVATERRGHAEFLKFLAEIDRRRLYLKEGYSSLFVFCQQVLNLSAASTCKRIQVTRLAQKYPLVLELISENRLTLTNASLLVLSLTDDNFERLLLQAQGQTKLDVERLIVTEFSKEEPTEQIRTFAGECNSKPNRGGAQPVSPARPTRASNCDWRG